jgi:hypothetical protein
MNDSRYIVLRDGPLSGETRWHDSHPDDYTETVGSVTHLWRWGGDPQAIRQTSCGPALVYDYDGPRDDDHSTTRDHSYGQ